MTWIWYWARVRARWLMTLLTVKNDSGCWWPNPSWTKPEVHFCLLLKLAFSTSSGSMFSWSSATLFLLYVYWQFLYGWATTKVLWIFYGFIFATKHQTGLLFYSLAIQIELLIWTFGCVFGIKDDRNVKSRLIQSKSFK